MQVAAGRAEELERTRPFGLVAAAFGCVRSSPDPRRAAIAALLAAAGRWTRGPITVTSDPGLRFRAVDAFADLAEELALAGPLVIGVDDLQWADPSSLLTLAALSRRLAYLPVALIGCLRPSPRVAELDRLAGALEAAGARHLALRGLAEQAVTGAGGRGGRRRAGPGAAGRDIGGGRQPAVRHRAAGGAGPGGGDRDRRRAGRGSGDGAAADAAADDLAPAQLPARATPCRRCGPPRSWDPASRSPSWSVTGPPRPGAVGRCWREAIRARVLEDDGARLRFRHDLIRDAIYEDLPLSVRRALHREAGQRLARTGRPGAAGRRAPGPRGRRRATPRPSRG